MIDIETSNRWLEFLAYLVTIGGVPIGISIFILEKRRERHEREAHAFDELDQSYVDFIKLCLKYPDVDVFEQPMGDAYMPTPAQQRIEHAIYATLISLFERAFVMFENQSSTFRLRQWNGWVTFMKAYSGRANFRRVWDTIGNQFDQRFQQFVAVELFSKPGSTANLPL